MFTVIICNEKIIEDCEKKYSLFLSPLLSGEFAFCKWNPDGTTPEEAVPDLAGLVRNVPEWRAVVVLNREIYGYGYITKKNPFDYTEFKNKRDFPYDDVESLREYRAARFANFDSAINNPLVKLSYWLCDPPVKSIDNPLDEAVKKVVSELPDNYFELFGAGEKSFRAFDADDDNKTGDNQEKIILNGDPFDLEADFCNEYKFGLISQIWQQGSVEFNLPVQVICISERNHDSLNEDARVSWQQRNEFEYRDFCEPNLYPARLRYLLYDIAYCKGERKRADYINFLTFLLIFAQNTYPTDALKPYRVYKTDCKTDHNMLSKGLSIYDTKLALTQLNIKKRIKAVESVKPQPVTDEQMDNVFLQDYPVNVSRFEEVPVDEIYAGNKFVQMVTDRPASEAENWKAETKKSKKAFVKFLKEPRRAVKRAAEATQTQTKFEGEQVFDMSDFQMEDVLEKINNDEQELVSVRTQDIYDTDAYKKRIDREGKRVAKHISTRMRSKTAWGITGVAIGSFAVGFIPLFLSSLKTSKSIAFSLIVMLAAIGVLGLAGFIAILIFRHMLKKDVKNYNIAMSEMIGELRAMMALFGKYLSALKGFMLRVSLVNKRKEDEKSETLEVRILKKHLRDIDKIRNENRLIFKDYKIENYGSGYDPYYFDYTNPVEQQYAFPYEEIGGRSVKFVQDGNIVRIPIDFVSEITISREEFYD